MTMKYHKPKYYNKPFIINGGLNSTHENLCIFAHHNPLGIITPIQKYHLLELTKAGMEVWLISSGHLLDDEIDQIKPFLSKVIIRKSLGRDFGSYSQGFSLINDSRRYNSILFINDSIYGPFFSIKEIINSGHNNKCDIFGMTDSWDKAYHLQSYFLLIKKKCIQKGFLDEFFNSMKLTNDRNYIIDKFEIGFSTRALLSGFKLSALFNSKEVIDFTKNRINSMNNSSEITKKTIYFDILSNIDINITLFCWKDLIESFGMPYLKRSLLASHSSSNPYYITVPDAYSWKKVISKISPSLVDQIEYDLKIQSAVNWSPSQRMSSN